MKLGEKLVRQLIAELDEKLKAVEAGQAACRLGPRTVRARMRWLRQDYDRLVGIAKRWCFQVK
jgi:hypothetical protein